MLQARGGAREHRRSDWLRAVVVSGASEIGRVASDRINAINAAGWADFEPANFRCWPECGQTAETVESGGAGCPQWCAPSRRQQA
ncbi:MAG TPA: hypothetical protein VII81_02635 [Terriglobales bacterium]